MYLWYWRRHPEQYEKAERNEKHPTGFLPTKNTDPEGIRDYYRFNLEAVHSLLVSEKKITPDYELFFDKERLAEAEIDAFKKSKAYEEMSEEKRQACIDYIEKDPFEDKEGIQII